LCCLSIVTHLASRPFPYTTLFRSGYDVLSCSSGAEALEAVEQFVPQFILLDVMMPGMGGPETLAKLHERIDLQDIPVARAVWPRSEEHTSELQSREKLVCRLLLEK